MLRILTREMNQNQMSSDRPKIQGSDSTLVVLPTIDARGQRPKDVLILYLETHEQVSQVS